tara:strand:+ start:2261 stop:3316 length:1056 start_codon:yes stop_codon:yes gene_type:complete
MEKSINDSTMAIGIEALKSEIKDCITMREPVGIVGPPACGKSDAVLQASEELEYDLLVTHPVCDESIDYKGMPAIVEGKDGKEGSFLPFGHLKKMIDAVRPLIVFVDDIGQSQRMVQAALMQLFLNRAINGRAISEHVSFAWASNRVGDRAGADAGLLEPLKSRSVIYHVEPDVHEWIKWGLTPVENGGGGQPPVLCAFMRFQPQLFYNFEATKDMVNTPSARGWARVGRFVNNGMKQLVKYAGCVGTGAAAQFAGFERTWGKLPKMETIVMNPEGAKVPEELDVKYAVSGAVAAYANKQNIDQLFKYANRLPKEFQVTLVKDMIIRDESLQETNAFETWICENTDVSFGT